VHLLASPTGVKMVSLSPAGQAGLHGSQVSPGSSRRLPQRLQSVRSGLHSAGAQEVGKLEQVPPRHLNSVFVATEQVVCPQGVSSRTFVVTQREIPVEQSVTPVLHDSFKH
jgi:hypothetical protein